MSSGQLPLDVPVSDEEVGAILAAIDGELATLAAAASYSARGGADIRAVADRLSRARVLRRRLSFSRHLASSTLVRGFLAGTDCQ